MRKLRAKFYVRSVAQNGRQAEGVDSEVLHLDPVYGDDNEPWSKYTPSGHLEMHVTNPDAFGAFEPGQLVWLDISPAEEGS